MVASGFRRRHVCPFGKVVMCQSDDEGKTWTRPMIIMDTPLDDRDAGILPFGENGVIITSFNNTKEAQLNWNKNQNLILHLLHSLFLAALSRHLVDF